MTKFYRKRMSETLLKQISAQLDGAAPLQQLDLFEELALLRTTAADAVEMYSKACEQGNVELIMGCGVILNSRMESVVAAVGRITSVEEVKQKVAGSVTYAMQQAVSMMLRAAYEVYGDDYRVKQLEEKLRDYMVIKEVGDEALGTLLTPDQDAVAMDNTIPKEPLRIGSDADESEINEHGEENNSENGESEAEELS